MDYYTSSILKCTHTHEHTHSHTLQPKPLIISIEQMISGCTFPNWKHHLKTKYWCFEEEKTDFSPFIGKAAEQYAGKPGAFEINSVIYLYIVHKYSFQS